MKQMVKFFLSEEWKGKYAIVGAFLYIFTAVLITFLSLPGMDPLQYSAIFWVVVIFTTLTGISKSFIQMRKGSFAFWHQMCSPAVFLGARLVTSALLMSIFTTFAFAIFTLMHGGISQGPIFLLITLVTGIGISSIFTISSSIATKTDNPGVLLPVLTFPVIIPVVLIGVKAGRKAVEQLDFSTILPELGLLLLFDGLIVVMGVMLMKFIWRD
jgi:heme exporter protein B